MMDGIYLVWDTIPGEWQLKIDEEVYTYGKNAFLHEYVKLPKRLTSLKSRLSERILCFATFRPIQKAVSRQGAG
jgi:hypothetical protein